MLKIKKFDGWTGARTHGDHKYIQLAYGVVCVYVCGSGGGGGGG